MASKELGIQILLNNTRYAFFIHDIFVWLGIFHQHHRFSRMILLIIVFQ